MFPEILTRHPVDIAHVSRAGKPERVVESANFNAFAPKIVGSDCFTIETPEHPEEFAGINNGGFDETAEVHKNCTVS